MASRKPLSVASAAASSPTPSTSTWISARTWTVGLPPAQWHPGAQRWRHSTPRATADSSHRGSGPCPPPRAPDLKANLTETDYGNFLQNEVRGRACGPVVPIFRHFMRPHGRSARARGPVAELGGRGARHTRGSGPALTRPRCPPPPIAPHPAFSDRSVDAAAARPAEAGPRVRVPARLLRRPSHHLLGLHSVRPRPAPRATRRGLARIE